MPKTSRSSEALTLPATCVRVYLSGDRATERFETAQRVQDWLQLNRTVRPGCALFVNSKCEERGSLRAHRCTELERELAAA